MQKLTVNPKRTGKHRDLGDRFLRALEFAQLENHSYRELGKLLECTAPVIGRILHGQQNISNAMANKIATLTGIDYNWLATGEGAMVKDIADMTLDLTGLTKGQQKNVAALVRSMKTENKKEASL